MQNSSSPLVHLFENFGQYIRDVACYGLHDEELECVNLILPNIRKFGADHLNSRKIDKEKTVPRETFEQARLLGLFGLTVPEHYGGAGLSMKAACRVIEEMATFDCSFSTTVGLHNGLGLRGLIHFGSKELKDRTLSRFSSGEAIAAFSATEANAGSDISGVQTQATYDPRKHTLQIQGGKVFVTNGGIADYFTVLLSTPDLNGHKKGLSLVLVPRDTPGLTIGAEEDKLGLRGSSTTSIYFDNVVLSADQIIGTPGEALDHFQDILCWGRTLMAAGCLGTARRAHRLAITHALERKQFGESIARFGLIQEKVSLMAQKLFAMESVIKCVGQAVGYGRDISFESSVAKILCSEGAGFLADECIQILGGSGFIEETGAPLLSRDARITRIFEGTNEMLRLHSAHQILSWRKDELARLGRIQLAEPLNDATAQFGAIAETLKNRHRFAILKNQHALKLLSEAASIVYTMGAVVAHSESLLQADLSVSENTRITYLCQAILHGEKKALARIREQVEHPLPYSHETIAMAEYERIAHGTTFG